jgi:parallel beta-helix repeat protein
MSIVLFRASGDRLGARKRHLGVVAALLASVALLPNGPVSADGGDHDDHDDDREVTVREGESIQAAIDAAEPGTEIEVRGDHAEQIWINKDGIELVGKHATLSMPEVPNVEAACGPTLICVISPTVNPDDPFDPANYLDDVTISGFTLSNPYSDSIGLYFTNGATVERNKVTSSDCSGIWMLFANDFRIERNRVSDSANCGGIDVAASNGGKISRNTSTNGGFAGINTDDVSNVEIDRNRATGNCIGIVVGDSPGGDLPSDNVSITRNRANGNNTVCYPFGPPEFGGPPVGVAGILVAGATNVVVTRNTANDNVSTDPAGTITAGGIVVGDFGPNVGNNVLVKRNTARGNSTIAGPLDINLNGVGDMITVSRNRCEYSAPDAGWCTD